MLDVHNMYTEVADAQVWYVKDMNDIQSSARISEAARAE